MSEEATGMSKDVRRLGVLYEAIQEDTRKILELVSSMLPAIHKIPKMEVDIAELKTDVKVIKAVVTATNVEVHDHEQRITRLEAA